MGQSQNIKHVGCIYSLTVLSTVSIGILSVVGICSSVQAESLFRANVSQSYSQPGYIRHSLYAPPTPNQVGDIVTITISETTESKDEAKFDVGKTHTLTQNGTTFFNQILHNLGVSKRLNVPTISGVNNANALTNTTDASRTYSFKDSITCQVVQVLPNGHLVIQGQKMVLMNKENIQLTVSGIVNPFYLDKTNKIPSAQVANFQIASSGRGVISRQNNDGFINKMYQFFN